MKFEIDNDSDQPRRKLGKPPNYMSARVRLRLMSLMTMLILVLIAMKVASKPETWERLGFSSKSKTPQEISGEDPTIRQRTPDSAPDATNPGPEKTTSAAEAIDDDATAQQARPSTDLAIDDDSIWTQIFLDLKLDQRKELFRFLRYGRNQVPLPSNDRGDAEALVAWIERQQAAADQDVAQKIATMEHAEAGSRLKLKLNRRQANWLADQDLLTRVATGQTLDPDQLSNELATIQSVLDRAAFQQVKDQTSVTRAADGPAWIRAWEMILDGPFADDSQPVKQIQLISQPDFYRGKRVMLNGYLRGGQRISVPENELGIQQYYVLWMRPEESVLAPYCIYTLLLPDGFPTVGSQFTTLNETANVNGVFFKIRNYITKAGEVENCPLILAESFDWVRPEEVAETYWFPSAWLIWPFLILTPILAATWAYRVYRATQSRLYHGGDNTKQKIESDLVNLSNDTSIKTDRERIQMLCQPDADSPGAIDG